jgi:hypothetical protein
LRHWLWIKHWLQTRLRNDGSQQLILCGFLLPPQHRQGRFEVSESPPRCFAFSPVDSDSFRFLQLSVLRFGVSTLAAGLAQTTDRDPAFRLCTLCIEPDLVTLIVAPCALCNRAPASKDPVQRGWIQYVGR